MIRSFFCSSLAVAAIIGTLFISFARADDPMEALKNAQKSHDEAPAYRMKMVSTEANDKSSGMTVELVKPDLVYWKSEANGQVTVEMWSDGKKTYMRQGPTGEVKPSTMEISSLVTQARQVDPVGTLIEKARELKMAGHEDVKGVAASLYTFKSVLMNMDSAVKLWISDSDHRPIKAEIETHRELKGAPVHKKTVITYEYDPSIKIVVPGIK